MTPAEKAVVEAAKRRPWSIRHDRAYDSFSCLGCQYIHDYYADSRFATPGKVTHHDSLCPFASLAAALDALERERPMGEA